MPSFSDSMLCLRSLLVLKETRLSICFASCLSSLWQPDSDLNWTSISRCDAVLLNKLVHCAWL